MSFARGEMERLLFRTELACGRKCRNVWKMWGGMKGTHIPGVVARQNLEDYFRVLCWGSVWAAANWRVNYAKDQLKRTHNFSVYWK